ncbi:MAG: DUF5688 family protein [Butyrivibrio sp.]|uniref:DUF5688 family protein n=1 Tax=Butyrivibrio sp. TaxID=28121 RepID=UPI0025FFF292|nr:DUF5688 family protein [Butyrivibrio sp.]MCR5769998.1 DUF5688 family protein [Butyrivibrio sp.]
MEFKSFCEQIVSYMSEKYPESKVSISEISKNNGVTYNCLNVNTPGTKISEVIYLEPMYEAFKDGASFLDIINRVEIARLGSKDKNFDVDYFKDYDKVRDRIMVKLINYDKNLTILSGMPHRKLMDLAITYFCCVGDKISEGVIMIKNEHVDMWNIKEEDLYEAACTNAIKKNDYELLPLMNVVNNSLGISQEEGDFEDSLEEDNLSFLKILTNNDRTYGAATLVSPGLLCALSHKYDSNFYILPSSVHELILMIDDDDKFDKDKAAELYDMVRYVNMTEVETEDVLSDNVYYYDRAKDEVFEYYEIALKTGLA